MQDPTMELEDLALPATTMVAHRVIVVNLPVSQKGDTMATMTAPSGISPEVMAEALGTVEVQPGASDAQAVFWTAYELARAIRRAEGTLEDPGAELNGDLWYGAVCDWAADADLPEESDPDDLWSEILIHWARSYGRHRDPLRAATDALNAAVEADTLPKIPGIFPLAHRKTIALCHALAEANADREGVFFLSGRTLGERIGKSHEGARKDLNALVAQGWLIFVEDPNRAFNDAHSYRLSSKLTQYLSISKSQILRDTPISTPHAAITRDAGIAALPEAASEPALAEIGAAAAVSFDSVREEGAKKAGKASREARKQAPAPPRTPDPEPDPAEIRPEAEKTAHQNGPRATITPPTIPTPHPDPVRSVGAEFRACKRAVDAGRMGIDEATRRCAGAILALWGRPGDPGGQAAIRRMRDSGIRWSEIGQRFAAEWRRGVSLDLAIMGLIPTTPVITRRDHDHPRDHGYGYGHPSAADRARRLFCT